jgi:ribonuclease HI
MVVDEKAHSYKVILIFTDCVLVYKSMTNRWSSRSFRNRWRLRGAASAIMNGKLNFAELETDGDEVEMFVDMQGHTNFRVYEVDDEVGTWIDSNRSIRIDRLSSRTSGE